jgi:hypothetical protein
MSVNYCKECMLKYPMTERELKLVKEKKEKLYCFHTYAVLFIKSKTPTAPPAKKSMLDDVAD